MYSVIKFFLTVMSFKNTQIYNGLTIVFDYCCVNSANFSNPSSVISMYVANTHKMQSFSLIYTNVDPRFSIHKLHYFINALKHFSFIIEATFHCIIFETLLTIANSKNINS